MVAGVVAAALGAGGTAAATIDFGQETQRHLSDRSEQLFGVQSALPASSSLDLNKAQALADPAKLVTLARPEGPCAVGRAGGQPRAELRSDGALAAVAPHVHPCRQQEGGGDPGLQTIDLRTGKATTIATGIEDNDPVRATPWGTVILGEEAGDGAMYEIIDPLSVEGATIDRATGTSSSPTIRKLNALGLNAFEGLAVLPNGVTYYGNELAAAGGAYYKFVPAHPWTFGQGFQYGTGTWQPLAGANGARLAATRGGREGDGLLPARGRRHRHKGPRRRGRPLLRQQHRS